MFLWGVTLPGGRRRAIDGTGRIFDTAAGLWQARAQANSVCVRKRANAMRIERNHNLGQPEAIRRIDTFLHELMQRPLPGGVTLQASSRNWLGSVMQFSFKAKKGWLGTTITGSLRVTDQAVILDSDLPGLVTTFVSEEDIRALIDRQLDDLLQA